MHPYGVEQGLRFRVFVVAAVLSTLLAWLVSLLIQLLRTAPPWWLDVPSVYGFLAIVLLLYDKVLWNKPPLRTTNLFRIPDLNGTWDIELISSHDDFTSPVTGILAIRQSGSNISVSLETPNSTSHSLSASILPLQRLQEFELEYRYRNDPRPAAVTTMESHYGVALLRFDGDPITMEGEYFSGRGRHQHGAFHATRRIS